MSSLAVGEMVPWTYEAEMRVLPGQELLNETNEQPGSLQRLPYVMLKTFGNSDGEVFRPGNKADRYVDTVYYFELI